MENVFFVKTLVEILPEMYVFSIIIQRVEKC